MAFLPNLPLSLPQRKPRRRSACPSSPAPRAPPRAPPRASGGLDEAESMQSAEPPRPVASRETAARNCATCAGAGTLSCDKCNAYGFIRIDADTDWRTCEVCIARGAIPCPQCQPPDAILPIEDLPPIKPPRS